MKETYRKQIIPSVLILLFAYTAGSKLADFTFFRLQLSLYPYIGWGSDGLAIILPVVEFIIVFLLLFPRTRLWGLQASLRLLLIFTLYLSLMVLTRVNLPCSCGGVIQKMSWRQHIFFNCFFVVLTAIGIRVEKQGAHSTVKSIFPFRSTHNPQL